MPLPDYSVVVPAYGRDYKSKAEAEKDWFDGKDFCLMPDGVYCSCRDASPGTRVEIHYAKLSKSAIVVCK